MPMERGIFHFGKFIILQGKTMGRKEVFFQVEKFPGRLLWIKLPEFMVNPPH
jgi:hypothetical protein